MSIARGLPILAALTVLACAPAVPQTSFYRLELPASAAGELPACASRSQGRLLVQDLQVAQAYDEPRVTYRESDYRLERYDYHEWAAPLGTLVSDALADGYAATGALGGVERAGDWADDRADDRAMAAELRGRVLALEEVDVSSAQWIGHLRLELELRDLGTHARLWSRDYDLTRPLPERSPSGLAAATSAMLREIVDSSARSIAAAMGGACEP